MLQAAITIGTGWATTGLMGAGVGIGAVAGPATADGLAMGFMSLVLDNHEVAGVIVQVGYSGHLMIKTFIICFA